MNKPDYLGQSILELSRIVLYNFCYDYVIPKDGEKTKLCYIVTDRFIVYTKTENIYGDVSKRRWTKIWFFKSWTRRTITLKKKRWIK